MILQLNPTLPLDTPLGPGYAHFIVDYSQEHPMLFVCFIDATGECWIFPQSDVKLQKNITMKVRVNEKRAR